MDLEVRINGYRCNEETDGVGDDEVLFIFSAVPVDKDGRSWRYADRYQTCEWRFEEDVETGDALRFEWNDGGPIVSRQSLSDDAAVELWFMIAEVDGGGITTRSRASAGYQTFRTEIAERVTPGSTVGVVGAGSQNWRQPAVGSHIQPIGFDVWTVDLAAPLEGSMPPNQTVSGVRRTAPSGADAVYKNPKDGGGWLSETRSYRNNDLDARYTFEVEYRTV